MTLAGFDFLSGAQKTNAGVSFVSLKDWSERTDPCQDARNLAPGFAALEAARLRFRPIVMTSPAFILGVVPLTVGTGAGSASRHSVGTGVIGGMIAATFLAVLSVPLFFRLVTRRRTRVGDPAAAPQESSGTALAAKSSGTTPAQAD